MYKAEDTKTRIIFKSYDIIKLSANVINHPSTNYQLYIGYKPYTKDEFLKKLLQETKDYTLHSRMNEAIHLKINEIDYANGKIPNSF